MPKPLTLSEKLERFPPLVARLLARVPVSRKNPDFVRALTDAEIAQASGLPETTVVALSKLTDARGLDLDTIEAFYRGCRINLHDRRCLQKNALYMANIRGAPRYLRQSPDWSTKFEPLIRILLREQAKAA